MGIIMGKIDVEMPAHEVVKSGDGFEIRKYPPQVAATVMRSEMAEMPEEKFSSEGFRTLAAYIGVFQKPANSAPATKEGEKVAMTAPVVMEGGNPEKVAMTAPVVMEGGNPEKVAMTAPVVMEGGNPESVAMTAPVVMDASKKEERTTMTFLLPAKYTIDTAPVPTNPLVHLSVAPERTLAVIQWYGNPSTKANMAKYNELVAKLQAADISFEEGKWSLAGYNPPFTLPWMKRNEIFVPVKA